ncbi:MAG: hypothetical protein QMD11_11015 [Smithella sp.]|nr:hypothetical protein [Smithella sp.]
MEQNLTDLLEYERRILRDRMIEEETEQRVLKILEIIMLQKEAATLIPLRFCESPIEKILYLCLWENIRDIMRRLKTDNITVLPQHEFTLDGNDYRADFFIYDDDRLVQVVLECDGHNFHEKTKEQARRDKKRDRLFQRHGYKTQHFTGQEIYQDPFRCAEEFWKTFGMWLEEARQPVGVAK